MKEEYWEQLAKDTMNSIDEALNLLDDEHILSLLKDVKEFSIIYNRTNKRLYINFCYVVDFYTTLMCFGNFIDLLLDVRDIKRDISNCYLFLDTDYKSRVEFLNVLIEKIEKRLETK